MDARRRAYLEAMGVELWSLRRLPIDSPSSEEPCDAAPAEPLPKLDSETEASTGAVTRCSV